MQTVFTPGHTVQVDNTPLELTIVDKPDTFAQGKKETIYPASGESPEK